MNFIKDISSFLKERGVHPKELLIWLIATIFVTSAAVGFGSISQRDKQVFPVYISEILASNTSYPNADGRCTDFIELHNGSDDMVDLSHFQLGDIAGKSRYVFPAGTVLGPDERLIVYCDKNIVSGTYAPFEISRAGGENFYLIAKNKAIADSVTTIATDVDQSMILTEDGEIVTSYLVSPGKSSNSEVLIGENIYNPTLSPVRITEFSTSGTAYVPEHGVYCDWIEIYNSNDSPFDISGYVLSDNIGNDKYIFPNGTLLEGKSYFVIYCNNQINAPNIAQFGLSRDKTESLVLKSPDGAIIDLIKNIQPIDGTMALSENGNWEACTAPSPGKPNTPYGHNEYLDNIGAKNGNVVISELMSADQCIISDQKGNFSDWIELHNTTDHSINLAGWSLSDNPDEPFKWIFPDVVIEADEYLIVFCSGSNTASSNELYADFALSAAGEKISLYSPVGNIVDSVEYIEAKAHNSYVFEKGKEACLCSLPSPAYPNTDEGYDAFCASSVPNGPLSIWEVMASNDKYLPQRLGECFDWVEIKNISDSTVNLSNYCISDDSDTRNMHILPDITLAPGKSHIIILTSDTAMVADNYSYAPIDLDANEDQLFIYANDGSLSDFVFLNNIPRNFSYGRSENAGGFTYMEPTPSTPNTAGQRMISSNLISSYLPGVYSQEEGFTVDLHAEGTIYYTTDGSIPDSSSAKYTTPLRIDETTVLRAVSIEDHKLGSDVYTATFIIGDKHDLPVVSLVTEPDNLWGYQGIYKNNKISVKEIRVPANVSYSGSDGNFSLDCSLNLHGATTVVYFDKKSFAVRFNDSYDGPLHYDVFEDGEVTTFSSLIIRNSIESSFSSQMHDAMIGYIASRCSDSVISQKYKYVALYLNGEYWGLYAIRERHSEEHFASYMNVPAEEVKIVRYMTSERNELYDLYKFLERNNLRSDENYAYAKSVLDIDSYIDWIIFEAYMSNVDINGNIRYYKNPSTGLWQIGLADLDLGIVGSYRAFEEVAETFHHGQMVSALMKNDDFNDALARRLAELLSNELSDENVIALIDEMSDTIRSEATWEAARWERSPVYGWESTVDYMRNFCDGRAQEMIDSLCSLLHFTPEQRQAYFGELEQSNG